MADGNLYCLGGVGLIFILTCLLAASGAVKAWRRYRESNAWIPVPAEIVSAGIFPRRGSKSTTYVVNIVYAYQVLGRGYQGDQFAFGSEGTGYETHKAAEKVLAKYPVNSRQTVYCDPDQPAQAVLERKYDPTGAILAVILGLAGAGMIVYSYIQLAALGY